jgi:hypothetical protein
VSKSLSLAGIDVKKSAICRPGSDCQDVILRFFDPHKKTERAVQMYRFTVDVSDVLPVTVGEVRSWNELLGEPTTQSKFPDRFPLI